MSKTSTAAFADSSPLTPTLSPLKRGEGEQTPCLP